MPENNSEGRPDGSMHHSDPIQKLRNEPLRTRLNTCWYFFKKIAYEKGTADAIRQSYLYIFKKGPAINQESFNEPAALDEEPETVINYSMADFPSLNAHDDYPVLSFPIVSDPKVSIIIPVYNQWNYTYYCLKSILETCRKTTYEVIIGDDCSSDATKDLERYAKNVLHIRNPSNLNFLRNCNEAAKNARGKYLAFLNNDTVVMDGWLDSLVELIESRKDAGMVGSKLIYPDGTLQEAGGIVWSDGTGSNYGRGDNPSDYRYNYVRETDYISGASILVPRLLWESIGGFDERYSPAYFEDSDLAFEIRKRGFKVLYQPRSELVHFERASSGDSALKLIQSNRAKFVDKWRESLIEDSFLPDGPVDIQRGRSKWKRAILVIDDAPLHPDKDAGSKMVFGFMRLFLDLGYDVTFLDDSRWEHDGRYTSALQQMGIEVVYGKKHMHDWIGWRDRNAGRFDLVLLSRPNMATKYRDMFKDVPSCKVAYYERSLHFIREMNDCRPAHLGTDRTVTVPPVFYGNSGCRTSESVKKNSLLFVGCFKHSRNVDGISWFVRTVLPLVKESVPDVTLTIAGSDPNEEVLCLETDGVTVTGNLTDGELDGLYDSSQIAIVPIRFGSGIRWKTAEAMQHGMPVVSTSIGIDGLPGIENYISPCDSPKAFADEIIRLCSSPNALAESSERNLGYASDRFSYSRTLEQFRQLFGGGLRENRSKVRILDIVYYMDCPPTSGGLLRIVSPLEKMDAGCGLEFDMVFTTDSADRAARCEQYLNSIPVIGFSKGIPTEHYLTNVDGRPENIPEEVWNTISLELVNYLKELLIHVHYDIIQIEHTQLSWIVPELRRYSPSSTFVLDSHNIEYRKFETWLPYAKPKEAKHIADSLSEMRAWEKRAWQWFDAAISISDEECRILKDNGLIKTTVVPTGGGVDLDKYHPDWGCEKPIDILYIGTMNWYPNAHGLRWFIENVLPLIERERPGTTFHVVGSGKPEKELLNALKADVPVKFWGFQEDDVGFFHRARVFVIPLWIGAGARVKLITAWGAGVPVVSTAFGAEGSDARNGENILLADDPQAFANSVLRLLNDKEYGEGIAHAAFETVREKYTVERCADMLVGFYKDLAKKN